MGDNYGGPPNANYGGTMDRIWNIHQHEDTSTEYGLFFNFVSQARDEAITTKLKLTVRAPALQIADAVFKTLAELGHKPSLRSDNARYILVQTDACLGLITGPDREYNDITGDMNPEVVATETAIAEFVVTVCGERNLVSKIFSDLKTQYKEERHAKIKWWYRSEQGVKGHTFFMPAPNTVLRPEFYPGLPDPAGYIKAYLESDASVLLMSGEPGTGKTTLLRHMLCEHTLAASIIYDEEIMKSDSIFQNFLFSKEEDMLIIEDADTIISSRELDHNKLMSRFLNVSDGLIKLPNKKLVFTTNLTDFNKVDPALLRPGRCFDVMRTRPLTFEESIKAARAAQLPIPLVKREYTIAELFHQGQESPQPKIGFPTKVSA